MLFRANAENCAYLVKFTPAKARATMPRVLQNATQQHLRFLDAAPFLEAEARFNAETAPRYRKLAKALGEPADASTRNALRRLRKIHAWSGSRHLARLSIYLALYGVGVAEEPGGRFRECSRHECFTQIYNAIRGLHETGELSATLGADVFDRVGEVDADEILLASSSIRDNLSRLTKLKFVSIGPDHGIRILTDVMQKQQPSMAQLRVPPSKARGLETSALVVEWPESRPASRRLAYRPELSPAERRFTAAHLVTTHLVDQVLRESEPTCYLGASGLCGASCPRPCSPLARQAQLLKRSYDRTRRGKAREGWERVRNLRTFRQGKL